MCVVCISVKDCRGRWKSLRDRFVREHRTQQALNSAIEFENAESTWKYYDMLSFLQGNIHSRKYVNVKLI